MVISIRITGRATPAINTAGKPILDKSKQPIVDTSVKRVAYLTEADVHDGVAELREDLKHAPEAKVELPDGTSVPLADWVVNSRKHLKLAPPKPPTHADDLPIEEPPADEHPAE